MDRYDPEKLEMFEYVVRTFAGLTTGGWLRRPCPRCEDWDGARDYKCSLGYNPSTGGFNCFRCGMKGSLPRDWRTKLELSEPDESRVAPAAREVQPAEGYQPIFSPPGEHAMVFNAARDYVLRPRAEKGRGLSWEVAEAMQIGSAAGGYLAGRVIVPIPNYDDPSKPWRGWVARDYTGKATLPYRYPKGMQRIYVDADGEERGLLYNEPALWEETDEPAFIGEGVFDAAVYWPDGVACMGKPLESHLEKFRGARRPLVVCLDGDAWEEGWALAMTLRHWGLRAGSVRFPPKTDADEVDKTWLMEQARRALT